MLISGFNGSAGNRIWRPRWISKLDGCAQVLLLAQIIFSSFMSEELGTGLAMRSRDLNIVKPPVSDLIRQISRYSLRSNGSIVLVPPCIKSHPTLGDCAFQLAAPSLWNALPPAIRNIKTEDAFKVALKTHLWVVFLLYSF